MNWLGIFDTVSLHVFVWLVLLGAGEFILRHLEGSDGD